MLRTSLRNTHEWFIIPISVRMYMRARVCLCLCARARKAYVTWKLVKNLPNQTTAQCQFDMLYLDYLRNFYLINYAIILTMMVCLLSPNQPGFRRLHYTVTCWPKNTDGSYTKLDSGQILGMVNRYDPMNLTWDTYIYIYLHIYMHIYIHVDVGKEPRRSNCASLWLANCYCHFKSMDYLRWRTKCLFVALRTNSWNWKEKETPVVWPHL